MALVLHGYWRSGPSYRVRIGLALKGLAYETRAVNLLQGAHRSAAYLAVNPQRLVPALEVDGRILTQSSAILEWLEDAHPDPPLLPPDPLDRAAVRGLSAAVGADIHPLHNLRVVEAVKALGGDAAAWSRRWIEEGLIGLEALAAARPGRYAFGDRPTLADCYFVPMAYSARRFGVELERFPRFAGAVAGAEAHPAIAAAHPDLQPDAVKS